MQLLKQDVETIRSDKATCKRRAGALRKAFPQGYEKQCCPVGQDHVLYRPTEG
nr:hypothetical protein [Candidatus Brachybacter algidus]